MKIVIGLPHISEMVNAKFADSLWNMNIPEIMSVDKIATYRHNIIYARNKIASKFLESDAQYLLFIDDDMVVPPEMLAKLFNAFMEAPEDVGMVCGLGFTRGDRVEPAMFKLASDKQTYNPIYMFKSGDLVEADAVGMHATMISRKVFIDLKESVGYHKNIYGFFDAEANLGEDFRFCKRARVHGWRIFCDTSVIVPHLVTKELKFRDYNDMARSKVEQIKKIRKGVKR